MRYGRYVTAAIAVGSVVGFAGVVSAKTDPAVACAAAKLKAAGAAASAMLGCHAAAAQKGRAVDPDCIDGAALKLAAAFAKAEKAAKKAGSACPSGGVAAETQSEIQAFVAGVVQALRPGTGASKCAAKKLGTAGKYAKTLLAAHAAQRVKAAADTFADKAAKAAGVVAKIFEKLDDAGKDCLTSADAAGVEAAVAALVVTQVCDDGNRCTTDGMTGLTCQHVPVTCPEHSACDFRTGSCSATNCCLMSLGAALCVVEIPIAEIPTSQAFCQAVDAANGNVSLLSVGPNCIGWRAAGAGDCF